MSSLEEEAQNDTAHKAPEFSLCFLVKFLTRLCRLDLAFVHFEILEVGAAVEESAECDGPHTSLDLFDPMRG